MTSPPEETTDRILEAAAFILLEEGEGGLRVQAVADRAGLSTGAIYSNFPSRESLVTAARLYWLRQWMSTSLAEPGAFLRYSPAAPTPSPEQHQRYIEDGRSTRSRISRLAWAEASLAADRDSVAGHELRALEREFIDVLSERISELQAKGVLDPTLNPRALAIVQTGLSIGVAMTSRVFDDDPDFGNRLVAAWPFLVRGLAPKNTPVATQD